MSKPRTQKPTKVPGFPRVPNSVDPQTRQLLEAVIEAVDIRLGRKGDPTDRAVTLRELIDSGLAKQLKTAPFDPNVGGNFGFTSPVALASGAPAPTNVRASGAYSQIHVFWDYPSYKGHSQTEIWSHTQDVLGDAVLAGVSTGITYLDPVGSDQSRYYWVRHVNTSGEFGPWNSSTGTFAETAADVEHLLDILNESLSEDQFVQSLTTRLDGFDDEISDLETTYGTTAAAATSAAAAAASESAAIAAKVAALGAETDAVAAKTAALLAQSGAETAEASSETAQAAAETAQAAAEVSETNAATSATSASGSASSASSSATTAAASETAAGNSATAASTSETNASTYATNAETGATAAETAKTAAETAQAAAEVSETNAATSATSASGSASSASSSATTAAASETAAGASATAASTSETNASTYATNAGNSATSAASSSTSASTAKTGAETAKTGAETAKTGAETAKTNAEASATAAATSATSAAASETAAGTSATAAETAETAAETAQAAAAVSETNAATSATNASGSASDAATSATTAAASETAAGTSATAAAGSATSAATSATEAGTSATSAASSSTSASTAKTGAETAKTGAETAKTGAETAKTGAETAKTNAEASATAAATSATTAAASETAAGQSATSAASSATTASTKASDAGTYASNAATSATDAAGQATAAASTVNGLTARLNNVTDEDDAADQVTIEQYSTAIASHVDGLLAEYMVKVDVGGYVSGYGLTSTTGESKFIVNADKFALVRQISGSDDEIVSPFVIQATATTNPTVPAGVYIDTAFIKDADITAAKIGSVNADSITSGTLDVTNRITAGDISASKLNLDGVTLKNDNGALAVDEIAANAITSGTLDAGEITVTNLYADSITGDINLIVPFENVGEVNIPDISDDEPVWSGTLPASTTARRPAIAISGWGNFENNDVYVFKAQVKLSSQPDGVQVGDVTDVDVTQYGPIAYSGTHYLYGHDFSFKVSGNYAGKVGKVRAGSLTGDHIGNTNSALYDPDTDKTEFNWYPPDQTDPTAQWAVGPNGSRTVSYMTGHSAGGVSTGDSIYIEFLDGWITVATAFQRPIRDYHAEAFSCTGGLSQATTSAIEYRLLINNLQHDTNDTPSVNQNDRSLDEIGGVNGLMMLLR